ncbi:tRNA pseudouridine synthase Pus10-like isoform X2 [Apostichopus japonicus]|uniref:tRNA pseudouridine synthase Pus10-like isoform X2 n=1 Tax=Stichopus japonicus TaxID=307972 RepID=UPI003AB34840
MAETNNQTVTYPEKGSSNPDNADSPIEKINLEDDSMRKVLLSALQECHCCPRCQLRFQNIRCQAAYFSPKQENIKEENEGAGLKPNEKENAEADQAKCQTKDLPVCPLCLGILQDLCEKQFIQESAKQLKSEGYEFGNYAFTLSLPLELLIRQVRYNRLCTHKFHDAFTTHSLLMIFLYLH